MFWNYFIKSSASDRLFVFVRFEQLFSWYETPVGKNISNKQSSSSWTLGEQADAPSLMIKYFFYTNASLAMKTSRQNFVGKHTRISKSEKNRRTSYTSLLGLLLSFQTHSPGKYKCSNSTLCWHSSNMWSIKATRKQWTQFLFLLIARSAKKKVFRDTAPALTRCFVRIQTNFIFKSQIFASSR